MTVIDGYVPSLWVYAAMDRADTVFLDSSMRNGLGTRSYIGMMPYRIHDSGDAASVLDGIGDGDVLMGFISYDHGLSMNGIGSVHRSMQPGFVLADFDVVIIDDHRSKTLDVVCRGRVANADEELGIVMDLVSRASEPVIPDGCGYGIEYETPESVFEGSVDAARRMMHDGEFYVVNLSRRIIARSGSDPFGTFLRLRSISPSPFGAYLDLGGVQLVSSSMELLLDIEDGVAHTRPIKGTSPRTGNPGEDRESLEWLLSSEKDRSELLMVTDMERNDMNRFCVPGSVRVQSFYHPEEYSTLYHTVADVVGTPRPDVTVGDAVRCMFPGGSVTGAPKEVCMEFIDSSEEMGRGAYTGSIGLFSRNRTVMNIAIRTMVHSDGRYTMGVGGGITFESDPESEYRETVQKAKAMMRSLG